MALPRQIIAVPGAFAFHKPGADLGNFKQRVNDRKIHMREAELFFKEGITPSPGERNPDGVDPSLLQVRHSLTNTAIHVLRLAAMRSRNGKLSLAKEEAPLPCALSGDLFQYAVKLWIEDHDLTDRIHIEWSSSMTTLGMVVESNGSCTCSTSYRESEDAEPCSSDPIQAGPTGKRLTLMLSRRLKPRKEMLASLLDHEVCTHALRFRNEWMQPWAAVDGNRNRRLDFKLGLTTSRNVAATEEGLASLNGLLNKDSQKRSLVFPALMYLSASAGEGRTFAELFEYLSDFVESPSVRFGLCRKAKAGSGSERASIGRLQIYFEGAVEILRLVLDAKEKDKNSSNVGICFDPVPMHCGRVSVVDALRLSETMNRRQCILPHFLRTPEQCRDYVRCLESIAKLNGICVATSNETKNSVINAQDSKDSAEYPQHPVPVKATFLPQLTKKEKPESQHPAASLNETIEQCPHLPVIKSEALTLQAPEATIEGFFVMTNTFDVARPFKKLTQANDEQIIYRPSESETNTFSHTFSESMSPTSRQLREWRDGLVHIATDFEREQKIKKILENRKQQYFDASVHKGVNAQGDKLQRHCDELACKAGINGFSGNSGRRDSQEIYCTSTIWTKWRKKCSLAFESVKAAQRIQSWYRALQPRHSLRVARRGVTLMAAIARRLYQQKYTNGGKPELLLSYVTPIPSESERVFLKAVTLGQLEKAKQCLCKYSSSGSCRTISDGQQHSGSSRSDIGNISSQTVGYQSLGIDIRVRNEHGHGAINLAARNGKLKMLQWLHESLGLSLRSKANNGHSAAALAARNGHLDVLKYILKKCMDDLPSSGKCIDWNGVAIASMECPSVAVARWISYSNLGPRKLITPGVARSLREHLKRQQMEGREKKSGV